MPDYGIILESSATRIVRAVLVDGAVRLQQFTTPVELTLSLAAAEEVVALAEQGQADALEDGDAYLAKLLRDETAQAGLPSPTTPIMRGHQLAASWHQWCVQNGRETEEHA